MALRSRLAYIASKGDKAFAAGSTTRADSSRNSLVNESRPVF